MKSLNLGNEGCIRLKDSSNWDGSCRTECDTIGSQMQPVEDAASELRHISRHLNASFVILSPCSQFYHGFVVTVIGKNMDESHG